MGDNKKLLCSCSILKENYKTLAFPIIPSSDIDLIWQKFMVDGDF